MKPRSRTRCIISLSADHTCRHTESRELQCTIGYGYYSTSTVPLVISSEVVLALTTPRACHCLQLLATGRTLAYCDGRVTSTQVPCKESFSMPQLLQLPGCSACSYFGKKSNMSLLLKCGTFQERYQTCQVMVRCTGRSSSFGPSFYLRQLQARPFAPLALRTTTQSQRARNFAPRYPGYRQRDGNVGVMDASRLRGQL